MKHPNRKKIVFLSAALALFLGACNQGETTTSSTGSSLTTTVGDVTISALNGDSVIVHMPKEIFGTSETDVMFSTVEIWIEGTKIESKSGETLNDASGTGSVWFSVSFLEDGDELSFVVRSESGVEQNFSASISDSAEVTASLSGETPVAEEEQDDLTATFGQLSDERSLIVIPLEAFGDSTDDLTGATIDVSLNSEVIAEELDASAYYSSTYSAVRFYLDGLADGDALRFRLYLTDGSTVMFYGAVSADGDTEVPQS